MNDVPIFAQRRFSKVSGRLQLSDVYSPETGWAKVPRKLDFTTSVAIELVADGITRVRLWSRREMHEVSILQASILRPGVSRQGE